MRKFKKTILYLLLLGLFLPQLVFAVDIFFDSKSNQVSISQEFEVQFLVNSKDESVNAFEGKIIFPDNLVDLVDIRDGNSIVNFWMDKPQPKDNYILFSGITPGGFQGENGLIFSVIFKAKDQGILNFKLDDLKILKNDGLGSSAVLNITPIDISIFDRPISGEALITTIEDKESPELFIPELSRDKLIYNNNWFIVFTTQDKLSGISHYEVKESRSRFYAILNRWHRAESPYILKDQKLKSYIFIKATDKSGNERTVVINPYNKLQLYENYENWTIIIVLVILTIIIKNKRALCRKKIQK